jgi:predicted metalloprotease with PDZ domain
LIQDGAGDALEHRGSVTVGVRSAALAADPTASMTEIAHEFFHAWNLVAIHPDDYGELSFRPLHPTTGLWWGEGVTMHYADVLPRRAGLRGGEPSRLVHLQHLLENYYASSWSGRVSPAAASAAFGKSPVDDPNASGGYYVQGQLLAIALDAAIRDSSRDARGLDDAMRALFAQSATGHGFTDAGLVATIDSTCRCRLDGVFASQVRGGALIDLSDALRRIGLRAIVDTVPSADSAGRALPDLRLAIDFTRAAPPLRALVWNATTPWAIGGLSTGDELSAINGHAIANFGDLQRELHMLHVGDRAGVDVRRNGTLFHFDVHVTGYGVPRVRFVDVANVSAAQLARREQWMVGR